ncbi:MAG: rhodanese-like domain-containing protein [Archangium sp.]|nr:rhodanese-like domain-containing protein [Archangium sp.]
MKPTSAGLKPTSAEGSAGLKPFEALIYIGALALLSVVLLFEGRTYTSLASQQPVTAKELYALLSNPQVKVQVVDLRAYDDDHFLDTHVPGSVPLPECDPEKAPPAARERVYPYVMTVLVTDEGDTATFEKCRGRFGLARNLAGGIAAWSDANLPEDTGDYSAPKAGAGGGCL